MTDNPPGEAGNTEQAELDEFIALLRALAADCGSPSQRTLVKVGWQVIDQYGAEHRALRPLSVTAISNVLGRQRKGPPEWGWVATYVLACHAHGYASGFHDHDPGLAALAPWRERYRALRLRTPPPIPLSAPVAELAPAQTAMTLAAVGTDIPGTPPPRWPLLEETGSAVGAAELTEPLGVVFDELLENWLQNLPQVDPPATPEAEQTAAESLTQERYRDLFGEHGVELLDAAENGDADAKCRLAILLLGSRFPGEAMAWLEAAANDGDIIAEVLLHAEPRERRIMAAELAYELALPGYPTARHPGTTSGAETYYRTAYRSGHVGAAYRLALMCQARGDYSTAIYIFGRAANAGHPGARRHHDELTALGLTDGTFPCP